MKFWIQFNRNKR